MGVCLWCGQYQVGGDGTVSSEQINLSFSPEIPSTAFDSSPLSPKVMSNRLLENRAFDSQKQAGKSKLLSYPWLFMSGNFSFPCYANKLNYTKHEGPGVQDWEKGENPQLCFALVIWYPRHSCLHVFKILHCTISAAKGHTSESCKCQQGCEP